MAVSTRHAEIRITGNDYGVVDLGSVNGTKVNNKEIVPHRPRVLESGDTIVIANFRVGFSIGATSGAVEARDTSLVHAREIVSRILARSGLDAGVRGSIRSLNAIFEAPEEDTSSFAVDLQDGVRKDKNEMQENDELGAEAIGDQIPKENTSLPIGPADPLLGGDAVLKNTNEIPRPKVHGKGDMGLIVVGAVIVIAAVAGLVYLFS
jgi:pSer/pThr/pTyr-binding forkhead associated (FHA) protein